MLMDTLLYSTRDWNLLPDDVLMATGTDGSKMGLASFTEDRSVSGS